MIKDLLFYNLLDVEVKFTPEELRKNYKKAALKYHPDKNPNDPDAANKVLHSFEQIFFS
jgi:curved DNA-binding protein CbpA